MVQLNDLLGTKASLAVLRYFAAYPTQERHFASLWKQTKLAKATLRKWLETFSAEGFITVRNLGRMKLYRLNREHPFVKQFKVLDAVTQLLPAKSIAIQFHCSIYLFGSVARGEDTEKSDIDLLLLAEAYSTEIQSMLEKTIKSKRKITIHVFTNLEWSQMARKDPAFYERVEKDKIQIA